MSVSRPPPSPAPDLNAALVYSCEDVRHTSLLYNRGWTVLVVLPYSLSTSTNVELNKWNDRYAEFERLAATVVVSTLDSVDKIQSWFHLSREDGGLANIKFVLASDSNRDVLTAYSGLMPSEQDYPAVFLVTQVGTIHSSFYLPNGLGCDEVLHRLRDARTAVPNSRANTVISTSFSQTSDYVSSLLKSYQDSLKTNPVFTKASTSAVIAVIGELIGSFLRYRKRDSHQKNLSFLSFVDVKRLAVFASYGFVCSGPILHHWYGFLHRLVTQNNITGSLAIATKLTLNQLVLTPTFLAVTLFYLQILQTLNPSKSWDYIKRIFAMALYTNWKVWTPAQLINFTLIPVDYQVLYGNIVALWWNIYLSTVS